MAVHERPRRRQLIFYMSVFDDGEDRLLGRLVDITVGGIKLLNREAVELGRDYVLRLDPPEGSPNPEPLRFTAHSRWSDKDVNPDYTVTGFEITEAAPAVQRRIEGFIEAYGFSR